MKTSTAKPQCPLVGGVVHGYLRIIMDDDLITMSHVQLSNEVTKLRAGIRYIANQKGEPLPVILMIIHIRQSF